MKETYFKSIATVERLHRLFLEALKAELEHVGVKDINNVQSLILYNVGKGQVTIGKLTGRGYYLGSNITYNLSKMVRNGYMVQEPSPHDQRIRHVKLSENGLALHAKLDEVFKKQAKALERQGIPPNQLSELVGMFGSLETFWRGLLR